MTTLISLVLVGILTGWIADLLFRNMCLSRAGSFVNGVLGSVMGGYLFQLVGVFAPESIGLLATGGAGAILTLLFVNWLCEQLRQEEVPDVQD